MFAWLNGAGDAFREPVPNSTNYLSAYAKNGRRLNDRNKPQGGPGRHGDGQSEDSRALGDAAQNDSKRPDAQATKDLMPFPLNPHFISQSVLSEELRLEVWKRVQVDKKPVRQVSVELGIDMRRVGAVVRLVEVEKKMIAEVRCLSLSCPFFFVMSNTTISLADLHHGVINNKLQLSESFRLHFYLRGSCLNLTDLSTRINLWLFHTRKLCMLWYPSQP